MIQKINVSYLSMHSNSDDKFCHSFRIPLTSFAQFQVLTSFEPNKNSHTWTHPKPATSLHKSSSFLLPEPLNRGSNSRGFHWSDTRLSQASIIKSCEWPISIIFGDCTRYTLEKMRYQQFLDEYRLIWQIKFMEVNHMSCSHLSPSLWILHH